MGAGRNYAFGGFIRRIISQAYTEGEDPGETVRGGTLMFSVDFHEFGPKPSSFRRAALARIFWGVRFSMESELPQSTDEWLPTRVPYDL